MVKKNRLELMTAAIERRSEDSLKGFNEWEEWRNLEGDQRRYLSAYIACRDARMACEMTSLSMEWVAKQEKNPDFRFIIQAVLDHPKELAERMIEDLLPFSVLQLQALIEQDKNMTVQLNAIKHLHGVAGMLPEEPGNLVDVKIQMFGKKEKIVDAD